jgi:hypothetical protein
MKKGPRQNSKATCPRESANALVKPIAIGNAPVLAGITACAKALTKGNAEVGCRETWCSLLMAPRNSLGTRSVLVDAIAVVEIGSLRSEYKRREASQSSRTSGTAEVLQLRYWDLHALLKQLIAATNHQWA